MRLLIAARLLLSQSGQVPAGALCFTGDSHLQGLFRLRRITPAAPP